MATKRIEVLTRRSAPGAVRRSRLGSRRREWLGACLFGLVFAGWATPAAAQAETEARSADPHSTEVSQESLALIDAGLSLSANLLGFGLFAASFETDAAHCQATGSTNCGIAGTTVGMTLWVAMQGVVAPLASNLVSAWAGVPVDEGWSYAGAALASFTSLLVGGLAAYVALFPGEADIHAGIATAVVTIGVVHTAINLLIRAFSRPAS